MFCSKCGLHLNNINEPCKKCSNLNNSLFENSFEKEEIIFGLLQNDENFELVWENSIPEESNTNYEFDSYDGYQANSDNVNDYSDNNYSASATAAEVIVDKPERNLIVPICVIAFLFIVALVLFIILISRGGNDDATVQSETENTTEITHQAEEATEQEETAPEINKMIHEDLPEYVELITEDEFMEYETVWLVSDFFLDKGVEDGRAGYNNKHGNEQNDDFSIYSYIMEQFIHELTGKSGDSNIECNSNYIRFDDNDTNEFLYAPDDMLCGVNYDDISYFAYATDTSKNHNLLGVGAEKGTVSFTNETVEMCELTLDGKSYSMISEEIMITNGYSYKCIDESTGEELYVYADVTESPANEYIDNFYFIVWNKNIDEYSLYYIADDTLYPVNIVFQKKIEVVPEETTPSTTQAAPDNEYQNGNNYENNDVPADNVNIGSSNDIGNNNNNVQSDDTGEGENVIIGNQPGEVPVEQPATGPLLQPDPAPGDNQANNG